MCLEFEVLIPARVVDLATIVSIAFWWVRGGVAVRVLKLCL